jgi:hypothetical protein
MREVESLAVRKHHALLTALCKVIIKSRAVNRFALAKELDAIASDKETDELLREDLGDIYYEILSWPAPRGQRVGAK